MSVRAVLFDIDGTLVDSNEFHVLAWRRAFEANGHAVTADAIRQQIGKGADMLIPTLLPASDESTRQQITEHHDAIFRTEYLPQVQPFAHATELVRTVAEGGCAALLASSANRKEVDHYIELLGLKPYLTGSTSADDVNHSKPARDIFAAALEKLDDIEPEQVLVIGDTPYDVIAATRCGLGTIAVCSGGFTAQQLRSAGAQAVYANVGDLLADLGHSELRDVRVAKDSSSAMRR